MKITLLLFVAAALTGSCQDHPPTPPLVPNDAPTAAAPAAPPVSVTPPSGSAAPIARCPGNPPGPGFVCLQDCAPPVAHPNDPPPGFRWASPDAAASRSKFGCPICLSGDTRIATPSGEVRVRDLAPTAVVWTLGEDGRRVAAPLVATTRVPVSPGHVMAHVTFEDGREISISPGHPTCGAAEAATVAGLVADTRYDGGRVRAAERIAYEGEMTFDLRPAGRSGCYWANGVLVGSSLRLP